MARIRSVKPSIWSDQRFTQLSLQARLLCLGMISNADDDGRIIASGAALIGVIFPHDDLNPKLVERWRDEIAATGLITVYTQKRGTYAAFPRWSRHQIIRKKQKSTLPDPPNVDPECGTECITSAAPSTALSTAPGAALVTNRVQHGSRARNGGGGGDGTSYLETEGELPTTSGATSAPPPDVGALVAEFIDHCRERPPTQFVARIGQQIRGLVHDGTKPDAIRGGLVIVAERGLQPTALPGAVHEHLNARPRTAGPSRNDQILNAAMQRAQAAQTQQEPRRAIQ